MYHMVENGFKESVGSGQKKIDEYIQRIRGGESKEEILKDLPVFFRDSIERGLASANMETENTVENFQIPPQYEGLSSEVLEEIWTIPVYIDPVKTKIENDKKQKVIAMLRMQEVQRDKDEELVRQDRENIEMVKRELGIMSEIETSANDTLFNDFSVANGETDEGVFWYQYRNKKAKEIKESGQFEWGKERIYFDIKMEDMTRLRDLVMHIAGKEEIPIAFKHLDDLKTFASQKDGTETRFVVNFANEDDAKRFLLAMKNTSEYESFMSDRNMSYNGIRIDGIAEYASGFRESRAALDRIMQGALSEDGKKYTYKSEYGRDVTISADEYVMFKSQYEKISEEIKSKKNEWLSLFNN